MLEPWARTHKRLRKRLAWRLYQARDLARASLLHATTDQEGANLRALIPGVEVTVIPNGVDLPEPRLLESLRSRRSVSDSRTAVFLGRIYPVKGLPMLVEAWRRVRPPGWRLVVAGPDEAGHRAVVERAVAEAGLQDVVSFRGAVAGEAKAALLAIADLFILPTHSESFGMAIAEALGHGLPVLTTDAAPWPQLEQVECGWRVPPTIAGIVRGLESATRQSTAALRKMGEAGRNLVAATLDWNVIARDFVGVYTTMETATRASFRGSLLR
jgi:glycosyltransferase involved in cell wall biosynthesis